MRFTFTLALVLSAASILTSENAGAVFLGLSGIVTALFIGIVNVVVAWQTKGIVHEVKTKAEVIVGHVNSEKTAAEGRQRALEVEVRLLHQIIEDGKLRAALLAQSIAAPAPSAAPAPAAVLSAPESPEELQKIEKNTAETAANTAKTDSNVQGLVDDKSKSTP